MTPGFSVRSMGAADLAAVHAIECASQPVPWTPGMLRDCLLADYWNVVVEAADGTVVAFAVLASGGGDAHVLNIAVHPALRRQGIARGLMADAVDAARLRDAERIFLEVRVGNAPALALYRDLGFSEVGRRKGYYALPDGGREDAVVMARDIVTAG